MGTIKTGDGPSERTDKARFPLSVSQTLIWAGQHLSPRSPLYNMAHRFDFDVALDPDRFRRAFDTVVAQSDALRSVFGADADGPFQRILPDAPARLDSVDLSSEADPESAAQDWIAARARRPFDLDQATYDTALLRLGPKRWVWFLNQHHLATDAWSTAIIYRRVGAAYAQADESAEAKSLPAFTDQLAFEEKVRETASFEGATAHWREKEKSAGQPLRLYGRPSNAERGDARRIDAPLGADRTQRLKALAGQDGIRSVSADLALFTIFATALMAYLAKVSGARDIAIGAPTHNRTTPKARETIGLFIEIFPLSTQIDDDETFRSLFEKVDAEAKTFLRHGRPGASTPGSVSLFNVVLNYLNMGFGPFGDIPARMDWLHPGAGDPGHAVRVHVHDFNVTGELHLLFDVNTALFDPQTAARMPQHFIRMLDALLADMDAPIARVPLALDDEVKRLTTRYNETGGSLKGNETVITLFEAQAARAPDATALRMGEETVSYGQLKERADRIAQALKAKRIGQGDIVGVHTTRSFELVIGVLGILKAGAAYVPLEARLPEKRLHYILEDTKARVVIAQPERQGGLEKAGVETLIVDRATESSEPSGVHLTEPSPDAAAYVIYTSGSTGQPKGVAVSLGGLSDYAEWAHRTFAGDGPASFPLHTAFGFDLTVTSLFVPLISGGTIVIYPEPERGPDLSVLQVFEDDAVDVVKLTPAHLALVADQANVPKRIRSLMLGGENLTVALANRARQSLGSDVAIFNEYGPTEAVVGCMHHKFNPELDVEASVPVGAPADGVAIYLLDEGLNPVPQGVVGEIYIGGRRLAMRYWGRDDLTADRFRPDPFKADGRMYKTGDLARFNERGLLEYRGRKDTQVKIRGVRVETAEVEHALASHPAVTGCVIAVLDAERRRDTETQTFCTRCGLSSQQPGISFDTNGVCNICRDLDTYKDKAGIYFKPMEALSKALAEAAERRTGPYDCLMLLSGGKDSTYALYQLAALTPRILTVTLDNGYISEGAKGNIRRAVEALGVEHRFVTTDAMNAIFVDSLKRHSNVCNGCFKAIYTLAMQTALAEGIPAIVTGLSRGQFFETRLTPELFLDGSVDSDTIDRIVLDARKAYHRVDDAVSECMDVSAVRRDETFEKVTFIDFYRYCDVTLDEVYRFLADHAPWIRPGDTGRSTNCLINDVGIFVHKRKEGFHNYALPYSWDVRMGHKKREAALEELNDQIDARRVAQILDEIGYDENIFERADERRLAAYYTTREAVTTSDLRAHVGEQLIDAMIPSYFVHVDAIPLTENGKIDRGALPNPRETRPAGGANFRPPRNPAEEVLADLWAQVLRVEQVGIDDNFYDLGGDSIAAIQIAARASDFGLIVSVVDIFEHQTIARLATHAGGKAKTPPTEEKNTEKFALANIDTSDMNKITQLLNKRPSAGA